MMIFLGIGIENFLVELFKWNGISKEILMFENIDWLKNRTDNSNISILVSRISKQTLIFLQNIFVKSKYQINLSVIYDYGPHSKTWFTACFTSSTKIFFCFHIKIKTIKRSDDFTIVSIWKRTNNMFDWYSKSFSISVAQ